MPSEMHLTAGLDGKMHMELLSPTLLPYSEMRQAITVVASAGQSEMKGNDQKWRMRKSHDVLVVPDRSAEVKEVPYEDSG